MSYFENASVVYIPSAVKDGKTYSIKPTDGSGDLTFSRGSDIEATRVASNGFIQKAAVNLLLQSNSFSTTWTATDATLTSGQSGYDGTSDAWEIGLTDAGGRLQETNSQSGVQTFSVYAKAGTLDFVRLRATTTGANVDAYFNLSSGTYAGSVTGGVIDANIESVGGGWYRCSLTYDKTNIDIRIYPAIAYDDLTATSGNIYIQDAQLNYGLVAQDYQETTTTSVISGITNDLPRLDYSGGASCPSLKLEPSRQNYFTHDSYLSGWTITSVTLTDNYATSPEGVQNATRLTRVTSGNIGQNVAITSGTNYAISIFGKADTGSIVNITTTGDFPSATLEFDLSDQSTSVTLGSFVSYGIESYGNDWYRCWVVQAPTTSGTGTIRINTGDNMSVLLYGGQCETGSYPTSLIPTYGTSASCAGEYFQNLSLGSVIGQTEGVVYAEISIPATDPAINRRIWNISDGSSSNKIELFNSLGTDDIRVVCSNAGVTEFDITASDVVTFGETIKIAVKYANNDAALWVNGVNKGSDTSVSVPSGMTRLRSARHDLSFTFVGDYKQLLIFPTALSDTDLAALTSL